MEESKITKQKCKTFKERYQDPEYKEKHTKYICEKVQCDRCDCYVQRVALAKHKRSKKCMSVFQAKQGAQIPKDDLEKLKFLKEIIFSLNI
jgi:hypothetical protein